MRRGVRPTATSAFGTGRREAHDASGFYERFTPPVLSTDDTVTPSTLDRLFIEGDAREMGDEIPDGSVALVVTSPPYFAGKEYELALGQGVVPAGYLEFLDLLRAVFARCVDKLEAGGRIAVNVANLGRRPYRSLSADVIGILETDLGLLLRGEIVWVKGRGQSGSCAWGTFRRAANPVLRDTSERVVVASKGRFDRALSPAAREGAGLPHRNTIAADEFLEASLDVWELPPESARRVGHPAPFPVALPERLIELYTYEGDLVLDPFLGAGSTAVAAARTGRRSAGYDTDPAYIAISRRRVAEVVSARPHANGGAALKDAAERMLEAAGFRVVARQKRTGGVVASFVAEDQQGRSWHLDLSGRLTSVASGLHRTESLHAAIGRAAVMRAAGAERIALLTSHLPPAGSDGERALRTADLEAVCVADPGSVERLAVLGLRG
jgi:site-specific DNA-methyltransferase (adenine-specific)